MKHHTCTPLVLLALCGACLTAQEEEDPWSAPPLEAVIKIHDQAERQELSLDQLLDALGRSEVVLLGETHLDETTHRLEWAIYEGLVERTGGKVVLSLEMFERDVQGRLDDYLAGTITEAELLDGARPWGNYRTGYRPLIELAREQGLPVVAANVPATLRRQVAFGGREAYDGLPEEQRAWVARELLPNPESYWERFARTVRGHMRMMLTGDPQRRLTSSQSLWDNTMAESCVQALERYPDHLVLHVNGGFHSKYREGIGSQILARRPETRMLVVEISPVDDLAGISGWYSPERADFLVAAESRARGLSEGFHAVSTARELRYRVHVPDGATAEHPAPLLIWLPADGFRALDGMRRWTPVLGEEVAVAVVEPPYPQVEEDLALGGRHYWSETFNEDLGALHSGLGRLLSYVLRNFPADPERVVLAGEGAGATIVAGVSLYSGPGSPPGLGVAPQRYSKLRMLALPEPRRGEAEEAGEESADGPPRLTVLPLSGDVAWWQEEAKEYTGADVPTQVVEAPASAWELTLAAEDQVRELLGLEARAASPEGDGVLLTLACDTPRARAWAHRLARQVLADGKRVHVVTAAGLPGFLASEAGVGRWTLHPLTMAGEPLEVGELPERVTMATGWAASDLAHGPGLPLAAGPFGGTTILLVPAGCGEEELAAYRALEAGQVLSRRSRFAQLKVLVEGEQPSLAEVLGSMVGTMRSTAAIVPAVFCASGEQMRRWSAPCRQLEASLNLEWVPGLGGALTLE